MTPMKYTSRAAAATLMMTVALLVAAPADARPTASFRVAAFWQARGGGQADAISPFELQRMFDAYALLQAQEMLKISDEQYAKFLPRFKALQDARRQTLQQRTRVLMDVRRLLNDLDEAPLKDRLKQLQEIEIRGEAETRKAYEAIDSVLDVRQQAQFRVFEEQMERRKLQFVTRARQANRAP